MKRKKIISIFLYSFFSITFITTLYLTLNNQILISNNLSSTSNLNNNESLLLNEDDINTSNSLTPTPRGYYGGSYLDEKTRFYHSTWDDKYLGKQLSNFMRSSVDLRLLPNFMYDSPYVKALVNGVNDNQAYNSDFLAHFLWDIKCSSSTGYSRKVPNNDLNYQNYLLSGYQYILNVLPNKDYYPLMKPYNIRVDKGSGIITFDIEVFVCFYQDPYDGYWYVSDHKWNYYNFSINGVNFDNATTDPNNPNYSKYNTVVNPNISINWNDVLPQSVAQPHNLYINGSNGLKQEILNQSGIVQATNYNSLSINDFDIEIQNQQSSFNNIDNAISGFNNTSGNVVAKITFHPGTYYIGGKTNNEPVIKYININGFMRLSQTTIKSPFNNSNYNGTIADNYNNSSSKTFASSMSVAKVQQLVDNKYITPSSFFNNCVNLNGESFNKNNYVSSSWIKINNVNPNDNDGTVQVDASLYGYENEYKYLNSESDKWNFKFTLTGYLAKNNSNDAKYFTTEIINPINIDSLSNFLAETSINNNDLNSDIKNIILTYIVNNANNVFKNLNYSSSPINSNDISINLSSSKPNFNNFLGTINVDVVLKNYKAWTNGVADQSKVFNNITISGFKKQQPTGNILTTTLNNPNVSNQFTNSFTYDDAVNFLNEPQNISRIYQNLPPDAKILVDKNSYDNNSGFANGTVHLKVNCSSYYSVGDSHYVNNNPPNTWFDFTITGFKNNQTNPSDFATTIINNVDIGWNTTLPQTISRGKYINDSNGLKQALIDKKAIANPSWAPQINANDFDLVVSDKWPSYNNWDLNQPTGDGYDNVNGVIVAKLIFKPSKYYNNGTTINQEVTKFITISGFKKLAKTSLKNQIDNNYSFQVYDDVNNKPERTFATSISKQQVQNFVDAKGVSLFVDNPIILSQQEKSVNDWCYNTSLTVDNIIPDNYTGTIKVKMHMNWYENDRQVISSNWNDITFTLTGYYAKNNPSDINKFTTILNGGELSNVNDILPQFANDKQNHSADNLKVVSAIKDFLINNNITNLPPESINNISSNDLIVDIVNFDNLNGTVYANVTLTNNKGWVNGQYQDVTANLTFNGLKKVNETLFKFINGKELTIQAPYANTFASEFSLDDATNYLNEHKNELWTDLPDGAKMFVKDLDYSQSLNGKVSLMVDTTLFYNKQGVLTNNTPNTAGYWPLTINGFKSISTDPNAFSTNIQSPIKLSGFQNTLAQTICEQGLNTDDTLLNIKKVLLQPGIISNLAPGQTVNQNDLDIELINSNAFNNKDGSLNVKVTIKNNKAWINGVVVNSPWPSWNITVTGFKKVNPTNLTKNEFNVGNFNNKNWSQIKANEFNTNDINNFLNQNINVIFNNLPDQTQIKLIGDPIYDVANGLIKININLTKIYDDNCILINGFNQNKTITLTGFLNKTTSPDAFTTKILGGNLNNVADILPDQIKNNNNYLDQIKQAIINDNKIVNPLYGYNITKNDIKLDIVSVSNKNQSINVNVTLINGAQVNGEPKTNFVQNVTYTGFKYQAETSVLNNVVVNIPNMSNVLSINAQSKETEITTYLNQHKELIFKNFPSQATVSIVKDSYDTSNKNLTDVGQLKVNVSISPIYDSNGNFSNNSLTNTIILSGFKNGKNVNTSTNNPNINIPSNSDLNLKDILPSDISGNFTNQNKINEFNNKVLNYLVQNQDSFFNNLNPLNKLTISDIKIGQILNPRNIDGTVIIKDITINKNKVLIDGQPATNDLILNNNNNGFKVSNMKTQNPTKWNYNASLSNNVYLVNLDGFSDFNVYDLNINNLSTIINNNYNKFIINGIANIKINVDQLLKINLNDGSIEVKISLDQYYNDIGNPTTSPKFEHVYKISGFKPYNVSTTISTNEIILNNVNNLIPSQIIGSNNEQNIINQIISELLKPGIIQNLNPLAGNLSANNIHLTINQANNLNGSLSVSVKIDNPFVLKNGIILNNDEIQPIMITIKGFRTLIPTSIPLLDLGNKNNQNINDVLNNPNFEQNIKNQIINDPQINQKYPYTTPTDNDINITVSNINPSQGSFDINITVNKPWVDQNGNIINDPNKPYSQTVHINGFMNDNRTTTVMNGKIECSNIIASSLDTINNPDLATVKQAIINANLIKDTTSGKPLISINDIELKFISSDNLSASATFDVTINNYYACNNGMMIASKTFNNVTFGGFKQLFPTNIDNVTAPPDLSDSTPNDFINNPNSGSVIQDQISNAINNNPNKDGMFPDSTINPSDIEISSPTANDQDGSIKVDVVINKPWVDDQGNIINDRPYQQEVIISGFKKVPKNDNFWKNYWWALLIGSFLLCVLILLIIKKAQKDKDKKLFHIWH